MHCTGSNLAYVTALDGSLAAYRVKISHRTGGHPGQPLGPDVQLLVSEVWTHELQAPVFSAPAVDCTAGLCVVASVDGMVTGVSRRGEALCPFT